MRRPGVAACRLGGALLLLAGLMLPLAGQSVPPKKVAASLERVFGKEIAADSLALGSLTVLRVHRAGQLIGYAQVRDVKGKDQPITCLVATDTALVLKDVDVLVYRETYGGEVAYEPWRRQFRGRGPTDTLVVGKNIRGISGATISVNAVTSLVRSTLADLARWRAEGKL